MKFYLMADRYNSRFYSFAKAALRGHSCIMPSSVYDMLSVHMPIAKRQQVDAIILSNPKILKAITRNQLGAAKESDSLQNWAGACFVVEGIKIIVSRPFNQLATTDTGDFLLRWYVRKQFSPNFPDTPELAWEECDSTSRRLPALYEKFKTCEFMAVDIETYRQPVSEVQMEALRSRGLPVDGIAAYMKLQTASNKNSTKSGWCIPKITMIGYCGLFKTPEGKLDSFSLVLHLRTMDDIKWMRRFNALPASKICQNGGYEATHLIRYNAPLHNWLGDTFHLMHCWFAELPRKLDFISSMFIRSYQYWKEEAGTNMALYNAKDTYYTLWSWVAMVSMAPDWATNNYLIEFRKCFPAITCGLEGFKVDNVEQQRLREYYTEARDKALARLEKIVHKGFNSQSPKQVLALMNSTSITKFKKSDDKAMSKWAEQGPLEAILAELIREIRGHGKKLSTYINATQFDGRLLYEVNHGGTDTGRASSKASNLWTGTQIQNQDNKLRSMYIADDGWAIANCDGSQAESRTTAYISEDANLINSVETAPDFHTRNASLFFGIPEQEIGKPIRTLSKRVNHGSNYNMGASKLLETMGTANVLEAQRLLGLPPKFGLIEVCNYLLGTFMQAYPDVKGKYYDEVIDEIAVTGMLVAPNGWARKCFGLPSRHRKDKLQLNKYVAHKPQCLSVMMVDEAEFDFWYRCQIVENLVRLKAQVHDEVVYMVRRENYEYTKPILAELMARPITVNGRELIVPNDGGSIDECWGNLKD